MSTNTIETNQLVTDETQYEKTRLESLSKLSINPYPHKFQITITFEEYIKKYNYVENGSRHKDIIECIAGRVLEKRNSGKKLFFYTVTSNGLQLQYLADVREYEHHDKFLETNELIHRGDIVGVRGFVGKSIKGELSIYPLEIVLLTPCYKFMPKQHFGLNDIETRMQKRYLDMIANPYVINIFKTRSKIISFIRKYLDDLDFTEVETPILSTKFGGAAAKPFITYHNESKTNMYLRIATELHLKQLVVGGLDRVYEIGRQFRNESIDSNHQSHFSSLEYYMAYIDYNDLIKMSEELLSKLVMLIHGSYKFKYQDKELNFTPPFKKIDIISELESQTGESFMTYKDFSTDEFKVFLVNLCQKHHVVCGDPVTIPRLLDKLIGHFIEPQCINPTFLMNHPLIMSPLAKYHRMDNRLSERFELFAYGMELANAYTELNNHMVQENAFKLQQKDKQLGDEEVPLPDEDFIDALRYGLPPTGGAGYGIDRLIMLLTNHASIREVITFPM